MPKLHDQIVEVVRAELSGEPSTEEGRTSLQTQIDELREEVGTLREQVENFRDSGQHTN